MHFNRTLIGLRRNGLIALKGKWNIQFGIAGITILIKRLTRFI